MPDITLQQSQRAQLSVQQILSSQLLQLPLQQLEQRIYDELQENPMLELVEEKDSSVAEQGDDDPDAEAIPGEMFDSVERFEPSSSSSEHTRDEKSKEQDVSLPNFTVDRTPRDNFVQAVQHDSFEEGMLRELALKEGIGPHQLLIASEILGNLDEDGYLHDAPAMVQESLQANHGIDADDGEVIEMMHVIQRMDPPGIAVSDLRERLLVQLDVSTGGERSPAARNAATVLEEHFDDLLNNRHDKIVRRLHLTPAQLEEAVGVITSLDPHPFSAETGSGGYIVPDFIVTYEQGRLVAVLNDRSNLSVQVSDAYRDVLKNRSVPKQDRQFVRQKLNRAKEFSSAIAQRRHTLLKVIEALMQFQYGFFVAGPEKIVPLVMKDVAEKTGFDLSTISRAVNGKYVQTRFGTFELKYFFSGGMTTGEGEEMSTRIIKQHLKEMIEAEDSRKPLSDDRLAGMLEKKGIRIARRTVAKYREQMQIPVARLRKKIF
ncbi:MAG: RNA polymerase factor sigma-54 [Prosthecochloris sp.]|nr:RNA polymerase factor sigma-54 [Prosthecochloris sp.]